MLVSTITARGRTSVPQPIKDALHTAAGTKLQWNLMPDGTITVRAKTKAMPDLAGILKAPKGKKVQIEDMNAWRCI